MGRSSWRRWGNKGSLQLLEDELATVLLGDGETVVPEGFALDDEAAKGICATEGAEIECQAIVGGAHGGLCHLGAPHLEASGAEGPDDIDTPQTVDPHLSDIHLGVDLDEVAAHMHHDAEPPVAADVGVPTVGAHQGGGVAEAGTVEVQGVTADGFEEVEAGGVAHAVDEPVGKGTVYLLAGHVFVCAHRVVGSRDVLECVMQGNVDAVVRRIEAPDVAEDVHLVAFVGQ